MKHFTKTKEDFVCEQCGTLVRGTGYTNHCPKCLWSRHMDLNPGDRASLCKGMMEPLSARVRTGVFRITHQCVACGFIREQDSAREDDADRLIELSAQPLRSANQRKKIIPL